MTIFFRKVMAAVVHVRPWMLVSAAGTYLGITWLLLYLADERSLIDSFVDFLYFTATVASTIGFGDFSPKTDAGKLIAVVWLYPCSLLIYSMLLAKITSAIFRRIQTIMTGHGDFRDLKGATVIVGYHEERTRRVIAELETGRDNDHTVVLVATQEKVRVKEKTRFIHAERVDSVDCLRRAGILHAKKVLVHADTDAETFNACLAIREINDTVHMAAYFNDHATARRAETLAKVEAVVSNSSEMLVRAAQDPGAGKVLLALAATAQDSAVFTVDVGARRISTARLSAVMAERNATLIAVKGCSRDEAFMFRPFPATLAAGCVVAYIAERRMDDIWQELETFAAEAA